MDTISDEYISRHIYVMSTNDDYLVVKYGCDSSLPPELTSCNKYDSTELLRRRKSFFDNCLKKYKKICLSCEGEEIGD